MDKRISIDTKVWHGQACVKGTRIPVHQIIRMLANGDTIEELLEEYPSISRDDILACLDYAASLAEEELTPIDWKTLDEDICRREYTFNDSSSITWNGSYRDKRPWYRRGKFNFIAGSDL